jgi:hypothetical protein
MPDPATLSLINALGSGVVGGVVVAFLTYWLTRKKTWAEIEKFQAETAKIRQDLTVENISGAVSYKLRNSAERVIYDSDGRDIGFDFQGSNAQHWKTIDGKDQPVSPFSKGALTFETGGILSIQRSNTEGRYEVWLKRYFLDGRDMPSITRDDVIAGQRNLRIDFEAKAAGAEHTLRIVLKNAIKWVAEEQRTITSNSWTPIKIYFQISPTEECKLRIDDMDVSNAPSSIQIRNFSIVEKAA